jgi:glycosyltransferase involved in cell wall biosynthesis
MKILINTPLISIPAGVSNHYFGLRTYFSKDIIYNQYIPGHYIDQYVKLKPLSRFFRLVTVSFDLFKFIVLLIIFRKPVVLLNPSFDRTALKRDLIYLKIAKFMSCKVAVFFHGWDTIYLESVFKNEKKFSPSWGKADAYFVLAAEFKQYLEKLGVETPIHLTTTKVNDKLIGREIEKKEIQNIKTILFLGRVERDKGIFTTIDAFDILSKKYKDIKLRVVGYGKMLEQAKYYSIKMGLNNITFTGPLYGDDLIKEYLMADLYILPTTHGEGMPTSILEAMAFGLPVITRPVGGLKDFFENNKMGYLIESLEPEDYAQHIESLINDINLAKRMSEYNKKYAKEHFLASKVAQKLELILKTL